MSELSDSIHVIENETLPEAMVRSFIVESLQRGHCRYAQYLKIGERYVITTRNYNEILIIKVHGSGDTWWVSPADDDGQPRGANFIASLKGLNKAVREAASSFGDLWGDEPAIARLNSGQYAGNIGRLAFLIGNRTMEAICDPYLSNDALLVFTDITSLGGISLSQDLRLMALPKMNQGKTPQLTKSFVDGWFNERGLPGGEAKLMTAGHERFILLSGGFALVVGCSFNRITHDESAHLFPDKDLRTTFDQKWAVSQNLR